MPRLTIGMPTYNDFDGLDVTIQALRLDQALDETELLVVDHYGCERTKQFVEGLTNARYILAPEAVATAATTNRVIAEARGDAVLYCASHVLFDPGVVKRLRTYYRKHPDSVDLLQGPMVDDDLKTAFTHFEPVWRGQMWGIRATDPRGLDPAGKPFEIPMQGMEVFSCRRSVWPGFHPAFRGFGGKRATSMRSSAGEAGAVCACPGCAGEIASAVPPVSRTPATAKTCSETT